MEEMKFNYQRSKREQHRLSTREDPSMNLLVTVVLVTPSSCHFTFRLRLGLTSLCVTWSCHTVELCHLTGNEPTSLGNFFYKELI